MPVYEEPFKIYLYRKKIGKYLNQKQIQMYKEKAYKTVRCPGAGPRVHMKDVVDKSERINTLYNGSHLTNTQEM